MLATDLIDRPGMTLAVVGDSLEITSQKPLTDELRAHLSEHKAEIIRLLSKEQNTNQKTLPIWCSHECQNLIELHTPKGTFPGCRIETAKQISWMRLSFLKGCPEEMGESAMPFFPTSEDFK